MNCKDLGSFGGVLMIGGGAIHLVAYAIQAIAYRKFPKASRVSGFVREWISMVLMAVGFLIAIVAGIWFLISLI